MAAKSGHFGIVVSGGPAPGINGAISAAVIEALNRGYKVKGIKGGFKRISSGDKDCVVELNVESVSRIGSTGGSILETSRFNPFSSKETEQNFLGALHRESIDKLIVIGGDGSAFISYTITKTAPNILVAHLPKTIDNDLLLSNHGQSFGFATARHAGAKILKTLMTDAKTCGRWFLVTSMGRRAGFLALALGVASGATITLIPEEFADRLYGPDEIAEAIFGSIQTRARQDKMFGVAVIGEGILDRLDPSKSGVIRDAARDELGRLRYSSLELGDLIAPPLRERCKQAGIAVTINTKNLGFELRCHDPIAFDIEYTKFLGFGAVEYLLSGKSQIVVMWDGANLSYEPIANMIDGEGRIRSRKVELTSDIYRIAQHYMIR